MWLLVVAATSDVLDGWLARRLGICSAGGAYLDATADFVLVFAACGVLVARGVFPIWVLWLVAFMFAQFVLTSRPMSRRGSKPPVYDPVGKYFGATLYVAVLVLIALPDLLLSYAAVAVIAALSAVSLTTRAVTLMRGGKVALTRP
jgi:phosphatidylglycerophosphate synthase